MRYERTPKDSHVDTVWYEIDMLRYAIQKLSANDDELSQPDKNVLIEAALLHYRNLIRFFSGMEHRKDDLSTASPQVWAAETEIKREDITAMQKIGKTLDSAYYPDISGFLQHVTERRANDVMRWPLDEMYKSLEPAIQIFEQVFPRERQRGDMAAKGSMQPRTLSPIGPHRIVGVESDEEHGSSTATVLKPRK